MIDLYFLDALMHGVVKISYSNPSVDERGALARALAQPGSPGDEATVHAAKNETAEEILPAMYYSMKRLPKTYHFHGRRGHHSVVVPRLLWMGRALFVTSQGLCGLGPEAMESGDLVVVLSGVDTVCILRRRGSFCSFLGTACIPEMKWRDTGGSSETFEIV